ncbi:MAG: hypothetical protein KDJ69_04570 [Nitratireductor sp.]|nr:hypothetical protein [Nitratireductor sp.]
MREIVLTDTADQELTVLVGATTVTFRFRFMDMLKRWVFDLKIDNTWKLHGRTVFLRQDLIEPFDFGIGKLVAWDYTDRRPHPGRTELPKREVRLFLVSEADLAEVANA